MTTKTIKIQEHATLIYEDDHRLYLVHAVNEYGESVPLFSMTNDLMLTRAEVEFDGLHVQKFIRFEDIIEALNGKKPLELEM
jgi:hypothetical protein